MQAVQYYHPGPSKGTHSLGKATTWFTGLINDHFDLCGWCWCCGRANENGDEHCVVPFFLF